MVHYLESLFWHPLLTFQYSFHTNLSSYADTNRDNAIFRILARNGTLVASRVASNLVSIVKESERYTESKQRLTTALREVAKGYLSHKPFLGGERPNRLDFYLMAQLRTRSGSALFLRYLEKEVGGELWSWWMRMGNLTQYDPERITTL